MENQKGFIQILLIIGIVAALGVIGYVFYTQSRTSLTNTSLYNPNAVPTQYQAQYNQSGQAVAPIQNSKDLKGAAASLDSTDMTQIDAHLNALNSASAGF